MDYEAFKEPFWQEEQREEREKIARIINAVGSVLLGAGMVLYGFGGRPMLFGALLVGGMGLFVMAIALSFELAQPKMLRGLLDILLVGVLVMGALEGWIVLNAKTDITGEPKTMVVLGANLWDDEPSPILQVRLDTALEYYNAHSDINIVVTGGMGDDEPMSEASCMAAYLQAHGVPAERILLEDKAYNTSENLTFTKRLLEAWGMDTDNLLIVSNSAHLARVKLLAKRSGLRVSTLSAPIVGGTAYQMYFYGRESVAIVKSFLFDRG